MRHLMVLIALAVVSLSTTFTRPINAAADEPSAGAKYLFIDDFHVEATESVRRVYHQPLKHPGPVLTPDRPWEEDFIQHWNAPVWSPERKRWQLWYLAGEDQQALYAESIDGITWEKPSLGLVEWNGSKDNNLIDLGFASKNFKERFLALVRDEADTDPARRYKGLVNIDGLLTALVSADGIRWKPLAGAERFESDDQYRLNYDALNRRFLATVKFKRNTQGKGRVVGLATSDDFLHWTETRVLFRADETDQPLGAERIEVLKSDRDRRQPMFIDSAAYSTDVYNMPIFTYADLYLALPVMFHHSGTYPFNRNPAVEDGILFPTLTASRDLTTWDRLSREPFIEHSNLSDPHNWDYAMIHASPPVRRGDELWFYYTGARFTHVKREKIAESGLRKSPDEPLRSVFLAKLRLDGFASFRAGDNFGLLKSKPIKITGPKLRVNVAASQGTVYAALSDAATGEPIPGYALEESVPITKTDGVRVPLRWEAKRDVSELRDREVRVTFKLRSADLFAFEVGD